MSMTVIQHTELGSGVSAIEFNSIPNTFTDLVLYISARNNRSLEWDGHTLRFNGDNTSGNYTGRQLIGVPNTASSNVDVWPAGFGAGANSTTNTFSNNVIYIPNYAGATSKSMSVDSVTENNAQTMILQLGAYLWSGTAAISSIRITMPVATAFISGTSATLYGILKGSNGGVTVS